MTLDTASHSSGLLHPEDLECVAAAFELTMRYLNENKRDFDIPTARSLAADIIMNRALQGEHDAYRLWVAAVRQLQSRKSASAVSSRGPS